MEIPMFEFVLTQQMNDVDACHQPPPPYMVEAFKEAFKL